MTYLPNQRTVKGVRSFLGLANFYRRFIEGYAQVARPLNDLTKKNTPFTWKKAQQTAFDTLKNRFTTAPILAYPDNDRVVTVVTVFTLFPFSLFIWCARWFPTYFLFDSLCLPFLAFTRHICGRYLLF
jgi:hypothetical protein